MSQFQSLINPLRQIYGSVKPMKQNSASRMLKWINFYICLLTSDTVHWKQSRRALKRNLSMQLNFVFVVTSLNACNHRLRKSAIARLATTFYILEIGAHNKWGCTFHLH